MRPSRSSRQVINKHELLEYQTRWQKRKYLQRKKDLYHRRFGKDLGNNYCHVNLDWTSSIAVYIPQKKKIKPDDQINHLEYSLGNGVENTNDMEHTCDSLFKVQNQKMKFLYARYTYVGLWGKHAMFWAE